MLHAVCAPSTVGWHDTLRRRVVGLVQTMAAACYAVAVVALWVLLDANGQSPLVAFVSALVGEVLVVYWAASLRGLFRLLRRYLIRRGQWRAPR